MYVMLYVSSSHSCALNLIYVHLDYFEVVILRSWAHCTGPAWRSWHCSGVNGGLSRFLFSEIGVSLKFVPIHVVLVTIN